MFEEEDWNDDPHSMALMRVFHQTKGAFRKKSSAGKEIPVVKNRKKLLKTLQILKAASKGSQIPSLSEEQARRSDSEDSEPEPDAVAKKKKKKKRSRKKRKGSAANHQSSQGDLEENGVKGEEGLAGRQQKQTKSQPREVTKKGQKRTAGREGKEGRTLMNGLVEQANDGKRSKEKEEDNSQPAAKKPRQHQEMGVAEEHLNRKQWRNRMKNKKRNKNKFKTGNSNEVISGRPHSRGPTNEVFSARPYSQGGEGIAGSEVLAESCKTSGAKQDKQKKCKLSKPAKEERKEKEGTLKTTKEHKRTEKRLEETGMVSDSPGTVANLGREAKLSSERDRAELLGDQRPLESGLQVRDKGVDFWRVNKKLATLKRLLQQQHEEVKAGNEEGVAAEAKSAPPLHSSVPTSAGRAEDMDVPYPPDRSAALRAKMEERLKSARFRYINQQLYTFSSKEAQRLFKQDKDAFEIYHRGFTTQLERWPENPLNRIIQYLKNKPASLIVADFGCGDCKLARSVKNQVHSFDLVALNDRVTVCDMANVPLPDESVDVAVFCLSLMGTNLRDFLEEANRVLKTGGILKIAEVASRFEDVRNFINALVILGFKLISKDVENKYFYMFDFTKTGHPKSKSKVSGLELKACVYKKR